MGFMAQLSALLVGAIVTIAVLDPIANVQDRVEGCALLALEFHWLAMDAAEVLYKNRK